MKVALGRRWRGCARKAADDGRGPAAARVHGVPGGQPAFPREPAAPREGTRAHQSADQAPCQGGEGCRAGCQA